MPVQSNLQTTVSRVIGCLMLIVWGMVTVYVLYLFGGNGIRMALCGAIYVLYLIMGIRLVLFGRIKKEDKE